MHSYFYIIRRNCTVKYSWLSFSYLSDQWSILWWSNLISRNNPDISHYDDGDIEQLHFNPDNQRFQNGRTIANKADQVPLSTKNVSQLKFIFHLRWMLIGMDRQFCNKQFMWYHEIWGKQEFQKQLQSASSLRTSIKFQYIQYSYFISCKPQRWSIFEGQSKNCTI